MAVLTELASSRPVHDVHEDNCHPSVTPGAQCTLLSDRQSYHHVRNVTAGKYGDAASVAASIPDVDAMGNRDWVPGNCMALGVLPTGYGHVGKECPL